MYSSCSDLSQDLQHELIPPSTMDEDRDLWVSDDEVEEFQIEQDDNSSDSKSFTLSLQNECGQEGGEPILPFS